jgi:hypothetical protein
MKQHRQRFHRRWRELHHVHTKMQMTQDDFYHQKAWDWRGEVAWEMYRGFGQVWLLDIS